MHDSPRLRETIFKMDVGPIWLAACLPCWQMSSLPDLWTGAVDCHPIIREPLFCTVACWSACQPGFDVCGASKVRIALFQILAFMPCCGALDVLSMERACRVSATSHTSRMHARPLRHVHSSRSFALRSTRRLLDMISGSFP